MDGLGARRARHLRLMSDLAQIWTCVSKVDLSMDMAQPGPTQPMNTPTKVCDLAQLEQARSGF